MCTVCNGSQCAAALLWPSRQPSYCLRRTPHPVIGCLPNVYPIWEHTPQAVKIDGKNKRNPNLSLTDLL